MSYRHWKLLFSHEYKFKFSSFLFSCERWNSPETLLFFSDDTNLCCVLSRQVVVVSIHNNENDTVPWWRLVSIEFGPCSWAPTWTQSLWAASHVASVLLSLSLIQSGSDSCGREFLVSNEEVALMNENNIKRRQICLQWLWLIKSIQRNIPCELFSPVQN